MEDELNARLRRVGGNLLLVTDDSGRVFAAAGSNGVTVPRGTNLTSLGAVAHALDPRAPADVGGLGVLRTDVGYYQVAAYPLVQAGITLGSLVLGRRLDSAFINAARATSDAGVILTAGAVVVAAGDSVVDAAAAAPLLAARGTDTAAVTVRVEGDDYVVAPVLLGETQSREPVRLWMLHPLTSRVTALLRPLRTKFFIYGAFAVFVAAVGAAFTARTVLGPVTRFIGYMRSGATAEERQGRFDASNEALEVRTLNESFNQLMDSLATRRRELEERTAELITANVVLTDEISERRRVEQALRESQAQLRQSQKLEAIGTLAGGIAHDFNNLITVITGYTQLALMRTPQGTPEAADLRQVVDASDRAANLTHQLLAFSRKQVLQPTVLDLGAVVDGIAPMLQRIIGENIELFIESAGPLARVRADRGQLEQVLLNLAVNARDAMSPTEGRRGGAGGKLTIGTRTVVTPNGASAVELAVSDTGAGMTDDVRERAFEPFFTTKEPGKGTGLGLSTVYGIVNQSGGTVGVDSTPGRGTTFTILLPASDMVGGGEPQARRRRRIAARHRDGADRRRRGRRSHSGAAHVAGARLHRADRARRTGSDGDRRRAARGSAAHRHRDATHERSAARRQVRGDARPSDRGLHVRLRRRRSVAVRARSRRRVRAQAVQSGDALSRRSLGARRAEGRRGRMRRTDRWTGGRVDGWTGTATKVQTSRSEKSDVRRLTSDVRPLPVHPSTRPPVHLFLCALALIVMAISPAGAQGGLLASGHRRR